MWVKWFNCMGSFFIKVKECQSYIKQSEAALSRTKVIFGHIPSVTGTLVMCTCLIQLVRATVCRHTYIYIFLPSLIQKIEATTCIQATFVAAAH